MPKATWSQQNFNGGEWSPLMYGRVGIDKYKTSLALCSNFIPQIQGGLTRRPGTRFVTEVKDSTNAVRLVRFEFSITQAYVLEFGNNYIRFCANDGQVLNAGGTAPLEVTTTYLASELNQLSFAQSADTLYIAHPNHPPAKLQRFGATNWQLNTINFYDGPYMPMNTSTTTLTPSGLGPGSVTVTASSIVGINNDTGFQAGDVGRSIRIKNGAAWGWGTITAVGSTTSVTVNVQEAFGGVGATATATLSVSTVGSITVTNSGNGYGTTPLVTFSGGGGSGAAASGGVTLDTGTVIAIQLSNQGTGYTSAPTVSITPPAGTTAAATVNWRLGLWGTINGYPSSVVFFEDRLYWAGCTQFPQRLDGSNVSDYENFAPTETNGVVTDANAVGFSLNANDVNAIRWMVSDERGLLIGTAGAEWLLRATSFGYPITPTNVQAKPSSFYGSAQVLPVKAGRYTLFIQRDSRKIRELAYLFQIDGFQALDVSAVSEHLLNAGINQLAIQKTPQQIIWMARNDGTLIGLTYEKEQEVVAFHQHTIGGFYDSAKTIPAKVESVACIPAPDTSRDELWVLVNRNINGVQKRYIEVMTKLWTHGDAVQNAVFLDSSSLYSGAPATHISGLSWLEGQTVQVLADGATRPDCVVSGGAINLTTAASVVQVGFTYNSDGMTLKPEAGAADGTAQAKLKRVHRAAFRLLDTVGLQVGATFSDLIEVPFRSSANQMDNAVPLFSDDKAWITIEDTYERGGQLCWRQSQPLPANIQLIVAQLETQDAG